MCDVAVEKWDAHWISFEPETALNQRAEELAGRKYSRIEYNQRR